MSRRGPFSRRDLLRQLFSPGDDNADPVPTPVARTPDERADQQADHAASAPPVIGVVHRPPGAVDEARFLAECTRCGDCIKACPVDAITLAGPRAGAAAGSPIIDPMTSPCVMCEDMPCIASCEPGVLTHDAPLRMGTAEIRSGYCLAFQGTICTVCSERCPVEGAIEVTSGRPKIVDDRCTGCGVCQYVCPAPYNAVVILPSGGEGLTQLPSDPPASSVEGGLDWRAAYFKGRSLRPPGEGTEAGDGK